MRPIGTWPAISGGDDAHPTTKQSPRAVAVREFKGPNAGVQPRPCHSLLLRISRMPGGMAVGWNSLLDDIAPRRYDAIACEYRKG